MYILQDFGCIPFREGDSLIKSYMRWDILAHAHRTLKSRKFSDERLKQYCAVFEWPSHEYLLVNKLKWAGNLLQRYTSDRITNNMESAVFVDVR